MEQHTRKQVLLSLALAGVLSLPAMAPVEAGTVTDLRQFPQLQAEKAAAGQPAATAAKKEDKGGTKSKTGDKAKTGTKKAGKKRLRKQVPCRKSPMTGVKDL